MKKSGVILVGMLCLTALLLIAACGQGGPGLQASSDDATITALGKNDAPVADAGADQGVLVGVAVTLDGSGSYDPEGADLTYLWQLVSVPAGSAAALSNATAVNPSFTPDMDGAYEVSLTVNDGSKSSSPDSVVVSAVTFSLIPDTGQTIRLHNNPVVNGLDADYNINPPAYTDNGDGTVSDLVTGLMWQQDTTFGLYDPAICENLTLAGHDDWRVPSKKELFSLINHTGPDPVISAIDENYFIVGAGRYGIMFSSTTVPGTGTRKIPLRYWRMDQRGELSYGENTLPFAMRCVRGNPYQAVKVFNDNGDGTVTDIGTGLMWLQDDVLITDVRYDSLVYYCEDLSLAGHDDWRMPNIKELESLTVDTLTEPTADTSVFPGISSSVYLSFTVDPSLTFGVTGIHFGYGGTLAQTGGNAKCVR